MVPPVGMPEDLPIPNVRALHYPISAASFMQGIATYVLVSLDNFVVMSEKVWNQKRRRGTGPCRIIGDPSV